MHMSAARRLPRACRPRIGRFRDALKEMLAVRDFVGSPERILGSAGTKHGEIAEQVHVGVQRANDVLHHRAPTAALEHVPRTGPVDYVYGGTEMQKNRQSSSSTHPGSMWT